MMAPFSSKAVITFEDIPVTKTARRFLIIENPTDAQLQVQLSCKNTQKPIKGLQFEWLEGDVPSMGESTVEISWTPTEPVACKETFFVADQRGFKKELHIIFKSTGGAKVAAAATRKPLRARNLLTVNNANKMRLKTPSPPPKKRVTGKRLSPMNDPPYKATTLMRTKTTPKRGGPNPRLLQQQQQSRGVMDFSQSQFMMDDGDKENSPVTSYHNGHGQQQRQGMIIEASMDASDIFKNIQFTPAGDRNNRGLDYMASLPTPTLGDVNNILTQQHQNVSTVLTGKKIVWSPIFEGIREEVRLSRQSLVTASREILVKTPEIVVTEPQEPIQSVSD